MHHVVYPLESVWASIQDLICPAKREAPWLTGNNFSRGQIVHYSKSSYVRGSYRAFIGSHCAHHVFKDRLTAARYQVFTRK